MHLSSAFSCLAGLHHSFFLFKLYVFTSGCPQAQVHCRYGNYESFGDGDHKEDGVRKFFSTHVCNRLCRKMKLRPVSEYDFIPPKAVVQFPGISEGFLRKLTAETLKTVRAKYGLADPWHK